MFHHMPALQGYRVDEVLHQSKSTWVCRGIRLSDQQPVVIKVLCHPQPSLGALIRFRNQYQVSRHLQHAHILRPIALERYGNGYALIMPDQQMLALAEAKPQLDQLTRVLNITCQLADALHYLTAQRVIHKNIKPSNILIHPTTG